MLDRDMRHSVRETGKRPRDAFSDMKHDGVSTKESQELREAGGGGGTDAELQRRSTSTLSTSCSSLYAGSGPAGPTRRAEDNATWQRGRRSGSQL